MARQFDVGVDPRGFAPVTLAQLLGGAAPGGGRRPRQFRSLTGDRRGERGGDGPPPPAPTGARQARQPARFASNAS